MIDCCTGLSVEQQEIRANYASETRFLNLDTWRNQNSKPPSYQMPSEFHFRERLQSIGVRLNDHVVMFDDSDGTSACQAAWLFQVFGFQRVQILEGKYAPDNLLRTHWKQTKESDLMIGYKNALTASYELVKEATKAPLIYMIIDTRSEEMFKKGSIPTAHNLP